jgi:hypothetical protein
MEKEKKKTKKEDTEFSFFSFLFKRWETTSAQPNHKGRQHSENQSLKERRRKKWKCSFPMNGVQFFKENIPSVCLGFPSIARRCGSLLLLSTPVPLAVGY